MQWTADPLILVRFRVLALSISGYETHKAFLDAFYLKLSRNSRTSKTTLNLKKPPKPLSKQNNLDVKKNENYLAQN